MTIISKGAPRRPASMRRIVGLALAATACVALAGCGGGRSSTPVRSYAGGSTGSQSFASGPISSACMNGGRKAANIRLCGCVQAVANQSLRSGADQSMAASFFADPHKAQEIRQSDNPSHEAFWQRYKAFSAQSERTCQGL